MTLQQFLDKLAETPRTWKVTGKEPYKGLRSGSRCPVEVVAGRGEDQYDQALYDLKLLPNTAERIINAADFCGEEAMSARLLKACGL